MGIFLSDVITTANFSNTIKPKLLKIVENIRTTFKDLVEKSNWMDEPTRRAMIEKSQAMKVNIGFENFLSNKTKVDEYLKSLNLSENSFAKNKNATVNMIKKLKVIGEPHKNPTEVNSYYYLHLNSFSK